MMIALKNLGLDPETFLQPPDDGAENASRSAGAIAGSGREAALPDRSAETEAGSIEDQLDNAEVTGSGSSRDLMAQVGSDPLLGMAFDAPSAQSGLAALKSFGLSAPGIGGRLWAEDPTKSVGPAAEPANGPTQAQGAAVSMQLLAYVLRIGWLATIGETQQ